MPRPPTVICYICQRQFGTASIGIHEKSCLKRWREENAKLPSSQRRPEPVKPSGGVFGGGAPGEKAIKISGNDPNIDKYNAAAAKVAEGNLSECPICHRKFTPDSLRIHQPVCHPPKPRKPVYEARKPDFDEKILRTPLKGSSIPRTDNPTSPNSGSRSEQAAGRSAPSASPSRSDNFPRCKVCNRTFAPDRLARHEMNCHASPIKAPNKPSPATANKGASSIAQKCASCGQALAPNSKFCMSCGAPVKPKCRACGGMVPPGAKFCGQCGQPVQGNRNNDDILGLHLCSLDSYNSFDQNMPRILRPRFRSNVTCYVCGEDFGAKSILIHEKYCLHKWSIKDNQLPKCRQMSLPRKPPAYLDKISYNRAARSMSRKYRSRTESRSANFVLSPLTVYVKPGLQKL